METLRANNPNAKSLVDDGRTSGQQTGGRWFKSNPRHQEKAKGSVIAPLLISWANNPYKKTWQPHLERRVALKPVTDDGFGGKEYEIKETTTPPTAPVRYVASRRDDKNFLRAAVQAPILYCAESRLRP